MDIDPTTPSSRTSGSGPATGPVATRPPRTPAAKETRGRFGRLADRLVRPANELEDEELQADAERVGATPICDLPNRERADVCGVVRSVTLRPRADVPALVVEIYDGSRPLHLVWLGRREITGIMPGVQLRAQGRVSYYRGIPTMFNPFYEIVPKGV